MFETCVPCRHNANFGRTSTSCALVGERTSTFCFWPFHEISPGGLVGHELYLRGDTGGGGGGGAGPS